MKKEIEQKNIFLFGEHPIMAAGITSLINEEEDLAVCGKESDPLKIEGKIASCAADLIFIDICLYGTRGIELIKRIKRRFPEIPILVYIYTENNEATWAPKVVRAGAMGYVMKGEPPSRLLFAIRKVLSGRICVSDRVFAEMDNHPTEEPPADVDSPIDLLTNRELQITQLIGKGMSNEAISRETGLPLPEVETHCQHVRNKLKLQGPGELLQFAAHWVHHEGGFSNTK